MNLEQLEEQLHGALEELVEKAAPARNQILVMGCSTSEVLGETIGTAGSPETARVIVGTARKVAADHGLYLAVQCCEHLNRALVVEREMLERYPLLEEVTVRPVPEAGGSAAATAYELFDDPVVVERISAHLGIDIGDTLIGMHLKRVAVPVRLATRCAGNARITAARTRPPLIGGERARY